MNEPTPSMLNRADSPQLDLDTLTIALAQESHARCPHCRYDLRGASAPRCPECGVNLVITVRLARPNVIPFALMLTLVLLAGAAGVVIGCSLLLQTFVGARSAGLLALVVGIGNLTAYGIFVAMNERIYATGQSRAIAILGTLIGIISIASIVLLALHVLP